MIASALAAWTIGVAAAGAGSGGAQQNAWVTSADEDPERSRQTDGRAGDPNDGTPPPVATLFGCPVLAPEDRLRPRPDWERRTLGALGVSIATPPGWRVAVDGRVQVIRSISGRTVVSLRRQDAPVAAVRWGVELRELGASHAGPSCERALTGRLAGVTGLPVAGVGVYGRPLGEPRRSFALFVAEPGGALTVVLTARWRPADGGPDMEIVRRVLGGLRPVAAEAGARVRE